jgi:plasmid stabilization system protein ParE
VLQILRASYVFQYRLDGDRLVMLRVFHGRPASESRGSYRLAAGCTEFVA